MNHVEIFLLAIALSVDACVVSFTYGLSFNQNRLKNALLLAIFTGCFQGLMPAIGYHLTTFVKSFIAPYANLIVFTIFAFLGVKFINEAFASKDNKPCCIGFMCLFLIGIATSIDALAIGVTFTCVGYKTFEMKIPNVQTRCWFNFLQAELDIKQTSNLSSIITDDIKEKL